MKQKRIRIREIAASCTTKYEEREALIKYGYQQNSARMCKKLMIPLAILIGVVVVVKAVLLPFEETIDAWLMSASEASPEFFIFVISIITSILGILGSIVAIYIIYRIWKVVASFDVFGTSEERTRRTEKYIEITHVSGNTWEAKEEERDAYNGEIGELIIYVALWLTACIWVWFYYLWVRFYSADKCKLQCSKAVFSDFSEKLKPILSLEKKKAK